MKIVASTYVEGAWHRPHTGEATHVALPLDVSQVSDAVVEKVKAAMVKDWFGVNDDELSPEMHTAWISNTRAAIAALAAALGEGNDA